MTKRTTTFKMFGLPLAMAAASLALVSPAQAQPGQYGNHHNGPQGQMRDNRMQAWQLTPARNAEIRQDIQSLRTAIDRAAARRTISQREATGLRNDARGIQQLYASYARGGLTRGEVQTLQNRVNRVRVALHQERRDWDSRRG